MRCQQFPRHRARFAAVFASQVLCRLGEGRFPSILFASVDENHHAGRPRGRQSEILESRVSPCKERSKAGACMDPGLPTPNSESRLCHDDNRSGSCLLGYYLFSNAMMHDGGLFGPENKSTGQGVQSPVVIPVLTGSPEKNGLPALAGMSKRIMDTFSCGVELSQRP
jgi:hypothetical protein